MSWNSARPAVFGRSVGQTFYALDPLITRITVWRYPTELTYVPIHLFVTLVDTVNHAPPRPNTVGMIWHGPSVDGGNSDPPGLPIRMDFVLDPPLALPGRGTYAFFVQREGCDPGGSFFVAKEPGDYPRGTYWITGRTLNLPCYLARVDAWEDLDLCFEVEYCRDATTPTRRGTWGQLKVRYH